MTIAFFAPGFRVTSDDGFPLPGGSLRYYAAGTTTPKAVYSDAARTESLGSIVTINSAGEPVTGGNVQTLVYPGTGAYRVRLYDANDILIWDQDNIPGAEEEVVESDTAIPEIPVVNLTTSGTHTVADRGKLFVCITTGGPFARTLPSAVTAGDGFVIGFLHNGSANAATILAPGSQNIIGQRVGKSFTLVGRGEGAWFTSNGADWVAGSYSPPFRKATDPYFIVLDRISSPPANPAAGARYLINDTPTGRWLTDGFAEHDIAEADGNGAWIKHAPQEGWLAFDVDEKVSLVFRNGDWENFQVDPGTSTLKTLIVQDQKSSGTHGGTAATTTWTTSTLNTSVVNTIGDASLASNKITLPGGADGAAKRYRVRASKVFVQTGASRIRFKTADDSSIVLYGPVVQAGYLQSTVSNNAASGANAMLLGEFEITESTDFILQYYVEMSQGTGDMGEPASASGVVEVYAVVEIDDLSAQQGPVGPQGGTGADGIDAGYRYQWSDATSGDPGAGKLRLNDWPPAAVTEIAFNQLDAVGADISNAIASWDDAVNPTGSRARIRWVIEGEPQNFMEFLITGDGSDEGDYWTFPAEHVASNGVFVNGNDLGVIVSLTGERGAPGTTVPDPSGLDPLTVVDYANDGIMVVDDTDGAVKLLPPGLINTDGLTEGSTNLFFPAAQRDAPRSGISTGFTHFSRSVPLNVREFGAFGHDTVGSLIDETTEITAAITQAISEGRELYFPGTNYMFGGVSISGGYRLRINGEDANPPAIYCPQGVADAGGDILSGISQATGVTLTLSADVVPGQQTLTVADTTGVQAGMLVRLTSNRLWPYDHRNQWYCGELHLVQRVVNGTVLEIATATWDAYDVSEETITMVAWWGNRFSMSGFHLIMPEAATDITNHVLRIGRAFKPEFHNVTLEGASSVGLRLNNSWHARLKDIETYRIGKHVAPSSFFGYGIHDLTNVGTIIDGLTSRGCRRAYDASGITGSSLGLGGPNRSAVVKNFDVAGGGVEAYGGDAFYPAGSVPSYGVGGHGPMEDTVFRDGRIANVQGGVTIRGRMTTVERVTFAGKISSCISCTYGTGVDAKHNIVDIRDYPHKSLDTALAADPTLQPDYFMHFGIDTGSAGAWKYDLPTVVEGNTAHGLRLGFLRWENLDDATNVVCHANTVYARPGNSDTFEFYSSAGAVNLSRSILGPNTVRRLTGSGTILMYDTAVVLGYRDALDCAVQVGPGKYHVVVPDDNAISIPNAFIPGERPMISIITTDGTVRGHVTIVPGFATVSTAGVVGSNLEGNASALAGTTGTDGKATISAQTDGTLYFENRMGSTVTATIQVL